MTTNANNQLDSPAAPAPREPKPILRPYVKEVRRKVGVAVNELWFRGVNLIRPLANNAIATLAQDAPLTGEGQMLVDALWDHPYHWLRTAMLRNAFSARIGGVVGLYEEGTPGPVKQSLRAIGLSTEACIPKTLPQKFLDEAQLLVDGCTDAKSIIDLKLPFGYPAHYLYDGILKSEEIGTLDASHPRLPFYVAKVLHYLSFYEDLLSKHEIRIVVTSHPTFPRFSTLIWCALRRGITALYTTHTNEHISGRKFERPADYYGNLTDRPLPSFQKVLSKEQRADIVAQGANYYAKVRARQASQFSILDIYGDGVRSRADLARATGADPTKPNIVVLTSCWSDGPNDMGRSYYTDYVDLLERKLSVISRVKDCNWILRPHPAEFMYGDRLRLADLVADRLPDNAFLWPSDFSGNAIPTVADCVVTPAGTAGIEYTALGLPVLVCRDTGYTPWGFTEWASDDVDLDDKLTRAWTMRAPSEQQRNDAYLFLALTFTSPPETRGDYLYQWGSRSWRIWPSIPSFIAQHRQSISNETKMLSAWLNSDIDSYNVFKWLHRTTWN